MPTHLTPTIRDLRQERAALRDEAQALLDNAESAVRDLTRDEKARFDELTSEIERYSSKIEDSEAERERFRAGGADDRGDRGGPTIRVRLDDGRVVPVVEPGQSFARAVTGRGGSGPVTADGLPNDDPDQGGARADAPNLLGRSVLEHTLGRRMLTPSERANMSIGGDPTLGNYLLSEDLSADFVDQIRAVSILDRAGTATMPLSTYETRLVKVDADPSAEWRGEHEEVASTDIELGSVIMRPRSIAGMVTLSEELAEDAENAPQMVESTLAAAVASELDGRLFRGGSEVPSQMGAGVLDTDGIGTVATLAGSAPEDYDEWLDAIALVEDANIVPNVRIDSPRTKQDLAKLKIGTGDARQLPQPAEVAALNHIVSSAVPTNLGTGSDESVSVVGNFGRAGAFVLLGVRSAFRLEATRIGAGAFEKLQVKVRIHGRYDIAVIRPAGLAKVTEIATP